MDRSHSPRSGGRDEALGPYLREIQEVALLSAEEERELALRVQQGDAEAREHMIRANLRLVVSIAKQYANRGLALSDLIEEGNVGLLKAVERFDPAAECRFSTYGSWWIKQSIRRALVNTARTVRVPSYMVEVIARLKAVSVRLERELQRPPTFDELVHDMGLDEEGAETLRRALRAARSGRTAVSLDSVLGEGESLADPRVAAPDEALASNHERARLQRLLDAIDPREAEVLKLRFGIDVENPLTLREIGVRLGVSRERVRQIETRALRKLSALMDADGAEVDELTP
jgi:RNA polymerase primary sigma factor